MTVTGPIGINLQLVDVIYPVAKAGRALSLLPALIVHVAGVFAEPFRGGIGRSGRVLQGLLDPRHTVRRKVSQALNIQRHDPLPRPSQASAPGSAMWAW